MPEEEQVIETPVVSPADKAELAQIKTLHARTMDRADRAIQKAMRQAGEGAFRRTPQR